jgi:hypothetical protein
MLSHTNTIIISVVFAVVSLPLLVTLLLFCVPTIKPKPRMASQSHHVKDTEAHTPASTPAADLPPYQNADAPVDPAQRKL